MGRSVQEIQEKASKLIELVKTRSEGRATLLPITKGFSVREIEAVLGVGLVGIGESYAQELLRKSKEISDSAVKWHMVGNIQRNKVRKLSPVIELWHSVHRKEIIDEISKHKDNAKILIQVDMNARHTQGGCRPQDVSLLLDHANERGLKVEGLMTIGVNQNIVETKESFLALSKMSENLGLKEVSMGMSDDFEIALECGATILRVGRGIFGERENK